MYIVEACSLTLYIFCGLYEPSTAEWPFPHPRQREAEWYRLTSFPRLRRTHRPKGHTRGILEERVGGRWEYKRAIRHSRGIMRASLNKRIQEDNRGGEMLSVTDDGQSSATGSFWREEAEARLKVRTLKGEIHGARCLYPICR
jgi:hypothetical protein